MTRTKLKMDKFNKYRRSYYNGKGGECIRQVTRKYLQTPKGRYCVLRRQAKARNTSLTITKEDFIAWFVSAPNICHYCHTPLTIPHSSEESSMPTARTIDRKDNDKGYEVGNMVLCCRRCNTIKSNCFTEEQMFRVVAILMENSSD